MCVCVSVPNHWKDLDEIWHRGCPRGQEGSGGGVQPGIPHPPGMGCIKGVWGAPGGACMALEVQCMAFLTCLSNKTKLNIQYAFKTSIESFRAMVGNHS